MFPNWTQMESFHNFQATKEFKGRNGEETHATLVIANNIFTTLVLEQKLSIIGNNIFPNDIKTKTIYL